MNEKSDIADLIAQRLLEAKQVTTLCAARIRPDALPIGDPLPAIRYETITRVSDYHLAGAAGTAASRVQFDAVAATRREANALANAINDVLSGLGGVTLGADDDQQSVYDITRDNDYTRVDQPTAGGDSYRYRRVQDYQITHSEPVPSLELQ